MPVITETLTDSSEVAIEGVAVTIEVAGTSGRPLPAAYTAAGTLVRRFRTETGTDGVWSVDLPANESLSPAGTAYRIILTGKRVDSTPRYVTVPATAGPHDVADILTDAPGAIAPPALAAHQADTTNVHGIPDTSALLVTDDVGDTVQAHSADLDTLAAGGKPAALQAIDDVRYAPSVLDEDDMASDSATNPPSQQSTKAYVDSVSLNALLDEDDFATDSATKAPSQQSVKAFGDARYVAGPSLVPRWKTGMYYGTPTYSTSTISATLNLLYIQPLVVPAGQTIDRLSCEVTAAGSAGALVRLGVYKLDDTGVGSTLIVDGGTVSSETTGQKDVAVSVAARDEAWVAFLAVVTQGVTCTLRSVNGALSAPWHPIGRLSVPVAATSPLGYFTSGVTGALASTYGSFSEAGAAPRIMARAG